ncbi:histidine kinase dimerization/phospho-acceptor domain-containing protein [Psychrobacter sp. GP33]|uniref:histidine kinase dimerization/phospho-acceptor domain-containing protein n=1 Tax=Psychrobacter sp. GP33 TaxID=2758709 RepID=UPI0015FAA6BB|nr:histidine kinase dimerization/phospho-acceptor domain-containing protein [Psychrobacter sp. GP33]
MLPVRQHFKSMQFQLIFWSVLTLLLLAIVAGGYGFWYSYEDFNDFQDDNLKSMSALLEQTIDIKDSDASPLQKKKKIHFETDEDEGSITVDVLNKAWTSAKTDKSPQKNKTKRNKEPDNGDFKNTSLKDTNINVNNISSDDISLKNLALIPAGISTQTIDNKKWRVYRSDHESRVIIVRQRTEFQEDLAEANAMQAFLPLLIAMAFLMVLLPFIMWRMLKPVRQLHSEINSRQESDLSPLSINNLPTELLPLAQSLNRLLALVKISIERQQRFIADAAHELRSPLTAVSLQLQRLQRINKDEVMAEGLTKLAIRLKRNQQLVEQLLTLARAGNMTMINQAEYAPVAVNEVIEQVIGLLIPIADHKNIALSVQLDTDAKVAVEETVLLMLIKNLVQNAIVYTPKNGQVAIRLFYLPNPIDALETTAVNPYANFGTQVIHSGKPHKLSGAGTLAGTLVLQIMDSGAGIAATDYDGVFEPFVRLSQTVSTAENLMEKSSNTARSDSVAKSNLTKNYAEKITVLETGTRIEKESNIDRSNEIEGTGLGLSIVKTICQQANIDVFMGASTLISGSDQQATGLCITLVF